MKIVYGYVYMYSFINLLDKFNQILLFVSPDNQHTRSSSSNGGPNKNIMSSGTRVLTLTDTMNPTITDTIALYQLQFQLHNNCEHPFQFHYQNNNINSKYQFHIEVIERTEQPLTYSTPPPPKKKTNWNIFILFLYIMVRNGKQI